MGPERKAPVGAARHLTQREMYDCRDFIIKLLQNQTREAQRDGTKTKSDGKGDGKIEDQEHRVIRNGGTIHRPSPILSAGRAGWEEELTQWKGDDQVRNVVESRGVTKEGGRKKGEENEDVAWNRPVSPDMSERADKTNLENPSRGGEGEKATRVGEKKNNM